MVARRITFQQLGRRGRGEQRVRLQVGVDWHQCWDGRMEKTKKRAGKIWSGI
jgi:hypothetical protein